MHFSSPAEIFGVDGLIILVVVALVLFGSTQIPKLARSLGSARTEFKHGLSEGEVDATTTAAPVVLVTTPAPVATGTSSGVSTPTV